MATATVGVQTLVTRPKQQRDETPSKINHSHARKQLEQARKIRADRIVRAQSTVAKAEERLRFARKETSRQEKLVKKQLSSEKTYDASLEAVAIGTTALDGAKADLRMAVTKNLVQEHLAVAVAGREVIDAQAKLDVLLAGSSQEEIDAARARLDRLEVDRAYVQAQITLLTIRSPIDGIVTTPRPAEKIGQLVEKGDLILEVYDYSTVIADIHLSEKDVGNVALGQEVTLKARAFANISFSGSVVAIASTAQIENSGLQRNVVRISTRVANADLTLKPGMSGYGKINLGKMRLYEIASRRLVRFIKVEFWSWW